MVIYLAGLRRADMKVLKALPRYLMFTYDDLGPLGGGEHKTLFFRDLLPSRGVEVKRRRERRRK